MMHTAHLTITTTPSSVPAQHSPETGSTAKAVIVASATASCGAATAALFMWNRATAPLVYPAHMNPAAVQ